MVEMMDSDEIRKEADDHTTVSLNMKEIPRVHEFDDTQKDTIKPGVDNTRKNVDGTDKVKEGRVKKPDISKSDDKPREAASDSITVQPQMIENPLISDASASDLKKRKDQQQQVYIQKIGIYT